MGLREELSGDHKGEKTLCVHGDNDDDVHKIEFHCFLTFAV